MGWADPCASLLLPAGQMSHSHESRFTSCLTAFHARRWWWLKARLKLHSSLVRKTRVIWLINLVEIPCPSSYVAGDRAGGLQQVSRSSDELPDRGGHGMAGTDHTTLWSWISPMRVVKAAPAPRACCFVKHKLPARVSSVQSCSQNKSVVFSRRGHLFGPECNTEVLWPSTRCLFQRCPLCAVSRSCGAFSKG